MLIKKYKRLKRHRRVRAKISGTNKVPRLCVFRSAKHIYAQLINDEKGQTLVAASDLELENSKTELPFMEAKVKKRTKSSSPVKSQKLKKEREIVRTGKVALAYEVGMLIAKKALEKKIEKVVFDRAGYEYHGRVKALAEGAREGGLKF